MTRFGTILVPLFILIVSAAAANAQAARKSEVKRIDAYCKSVERMVESRKGPELIFADVAGDEGDKPEWREFASTEALEKFRENTETYQMANNWRQNGRIVMSVFTLSSNSGDWAKYVYHCFRADGSLAKASLDYRTFYGDFIVLQDLYFTRAGRLLKKNSKTMDLVTRKPKVPDESYLEANSHLVNKIDYFMNAGKLPFASLVKSKSKR